MIGVDIRKPRDRNFRFPVRYIDLSTPAMLNQMVVEEGVDWIIHNASILSAVGERNPDLAMQVNIDALNNVFHVARTQSSEKARIRLFVPSSISAFGPTTPRDMTPNETIQRPTTIYGVSKVYAELMGSYFNSPTGIDFRSLRYPGILSASEPGGGTTDWAVHIFQQAVLYGKYEGCFLSPHTKLPMMHMADCIKATMQVMDADDSNWSTRVFNVQAVSLAPVDLEKAIQKFIPDFKIIYSPPGDFRQRIADSWPRGLDDSVARAEWGWKHDFDLESMTRDLLMSWKEKMDRKGARTIHIDGL